MKGDLSMRFNRFRKVIAGAAFAFVVLFSAGMISGTTAQAQDRDRDQRWDRNGDRSERRGQSSDQWRRWEREREERERSRVFVQPRYYPRVVPYGGYRNYGGGYGGFWGARGGVGGG